MFTLQECSDALDYVTPDMKAFARMMVDKTEGDSFEDDPEDHGGATKCGISLRYALDQGLLFDLNGDGVVDVEDIKLITPEIATVVFLFDFFYRVGINKLPIALQEETFDEAVNTGQEYAIKLAQKTVNELLPPSAAKIDADGDIGGLTVTAAHLAEATAGSAKLVNTFCGLREQHYRDIVAHNPSQAKYLDGWVARAEKFRLAA